MEVVARINFSISTQSDTNTTEVYYFCMAGGICTNIYRDPLKITYGELGAMRLLIN